MSIKYKGYGIMINHGAFEVGTYGRYSCRGEILHQFDSYSYGNSEDEVILNIKKHIDKKEAAKDKKC